MELKEFIVQTIKSIAEATVELQAELDEKGVTINPPSSGSNGDSFLIENPGYRHRRVQDVQFDVAVSTREEDAAEVKTGLRVYIVEARAGGSEKSAVETANRVKFVVPIALPPSNAEAINRGTDKQNSWGSGSY